jgi:hypothetical protein
VWPPHRWLAATLLLALAALAGAASGAPLPPASGDWVIDPGEIVDINSTTLTVDGNITLGVGSELHLDSVAVIFSDVAGKRSLIAPQGASVTAVNSSFAAARGQRFGGGGFFMRVEGMLALDACAVSGLSGPTVPNPFGETEGIHITNSSSHILNSSITGAAGFAITVTVVATPAYPTIADNTIQNSGGGIYLGGFLIVGADATIERNSFSLNALAHIVTAGSSPTIRNNSFVGSSAGVVALLGNPQILGNAFIGTLLNAVSVTQGTGRIEGNSVTATGIAFAITTSTTIIRNNTVTLSATGLQASGSTVTFDDNSITGAFAATVVANGSTVNGHENTLESAQGAPVVQATNGSALLIAGGTLRSVTGPGISTQGGSLTLQSLNVTAAASALASVGSSVTLRDAILAGGPSAPVVSLTGGSLDARGGEVSGGDDGVRLDGATSHINGTYIHGNGGYGIRAAHEAPVLSADEVAAFVNANGEGDLLYEADLTVLVENARSEAVANASVSIRNAAGDPPLSGTTGTDGKAGPVRITVLRVDSLNNEWRYGPFTATATFPPDARGRAGASLDHDQEVLIILAQNTAPTGTLSGPNSTLVSTLVSFQVNATDADGDPLTTAWSVDDGRTFLGPTVYLSFNATGVRVLTATVSDGFAAVTLVANITVLTPAQANQPPRFLSDPVLGADTAHDYTYEVQVDDPDSLQPVLLQLLDGPQGMSINYGSGATGTLSWRPSLYFHRSADALFENFTVVLRAFDGLGYSYQNFTLALKNPPDQRPALVAMGALIVEAGQTATLDLAQYASDPDDAVAGLSWRIILPNATGGAFIAFDARGGSVIVVQAPAGIVGTTTVNVTVVVEDSSGLTASAILRVELHGAATATGAGDSSLLATALAAGALVLAAFAFLQRRHAPPKQE